MEKEFGGPPFARVNTDTNMTVGEEEGGAYKKYTPSAKAHLWKTPTLVIHGAKVRFTWSVGRLFGW